MRRFALMALIAALALGPGVAQAQDQALADRNWHIGLSLVSSQQDDFQVFTRDDLPPGEVKETGGGIGLTVGRRFGERFILDFQLTAAGHEMPDLDTTMIGTWVLVNGTVLFREREAFHPFLRGGFGGGGWGLDYPDDQGFLLSFGTSAMTGAGFMVALSSRFSLEVEGAALFVNHLEVRNEENEEDENWTVRVSSQSWRVGMGLSVWF